MTLGFVDAEGGGGAPPGRDDGPLAIGASCRKGVGPFGSLPGGFIAGPLFAPPPTLNLAPLFGSLGIPPANSPPNPMGPPPPTGAASSWDPFHWLGKSEWLLLDLAATVANFPGPGIGGPPGPGPDGLGLPREGALLSFVWTFFNFAPLKLLI